MYVWVYFCGTLARGHDCHGVNSAAKHAPHDLVGKVHGGTVKDSGSGAHHQWPANAEDREKIWSEKGWQTKETPTYATTTSSSATHSTGRQLPSFSLYTFISLHLI